MKKYFMVMVMSSLLAGCMAAPMSSPVQNGTIRLKAEFESNGYTTMAAVSKYTQVSINHLKLDLYNGGSLITTKDILNANLGDEVTIRNLKANTTYTIKASAYKAAGVAEGDLISIPETSQVEVAVVTDDRPALAGIPVKLINTPFAGQATGDIVVTDSVDYTTAEEENFL